MDCREIVERLPWFVEESLAADERGAVEAHLARCAACRDALAATREASALFGLHLPAETIADYALGLPVDGVPRALVETHLAHCARCRDEVALVEGAESEATTATSMPRADPDPPPTWRRPLALAALLVAAAGLSAWLALRVAAPPAAAGRVALVELAPESARVRGVAGEIAAVDGATATTLLLATDRVERFEGVRARVVDPARGGTLWQASDLLPAFAGAYALLLPADALPAGEWGVELEGARDGEWVPIERYTLRVGR